MMTSNRNLPASGIPSIAMSESDFPFVPTSQGYSGLTKREQAAISIAAGISANLANDEWKAKRAVAHAAVQIADALFDALKEGGRRDDS